MKNKIFKSIIIALSMCTCGDNITRSSDKPNISNMRKVQDLLTNNAILIQIKKIFDTVKVDLITCNCHY